MSKFAKACVLSFEEWAATIPEDLPEPEFSKRHIKRMNILLNKMRGDVYHHFTTRTIKIILVAAVLLALLLTAFVFPSSRDSFIDNFNIASRYQMTKHNKNSVPDEITVGYIPEGFELEKKNIFSKGITYDYISQYGISFSVTKHSSSIEIDFNTEDIETEIIVVGNKEYTYGISLSNVGNLIWIENDYIYQIKGNITKEEMLNIATTIK